ncbi:rhomboid family intramembrane serine protease [Synechococcus sp. UW140]|uniref:rhomboid family intramembrane serine protease n=1 Tax=Synechococcus sp. UW140 TaxID=368503 RepID=UPI000E0F68E1|nr:rhomboid family intramembrane serine protease [Synechococcus sp. UW140]
MSWSLALPLVLVGIAWLQELLDTILFGGQWNLPLGPGTPWWSVFTAPFSHSGFGHLLTNTVVFLPLSYLVISQGMRSYLAVWIGVIAVEIPIWLLWPAGSHGLSGMVYGLLGFLLLLGLLERRLITLGLSVLALSLYGSALIGLLPWASPPGVSWIGHAGGFTGGVLAAVITARPKN